MRRPLPITLRLTLVIGLMLASVFAALGWYIMSAMESHFVDLDYRALRQHADEAQAVMTQHGGMNSSRPMHMAPGMMAMPHGISLEVLDANGRPVYQSAGVQVPSSLLPSLDGPSTDRHFDWHDNGQHYRTLWMRGSEFGILATISTRHHDEFLAGFGQHLIGMLTLLLVVAWGLSWFAVRLALAPLTTIRERAALVTVDTLDKRIPINQMPSEMVPVAQALNGMMARLEEAFERLVSFSSDLAHELRTPVSNLLTQIQVVLAQPRSDDAYRDALASSAEECERLSRMISEMLFLARAENAHVLPSVETVQLSEQIREVFEYYEVLAESRHVVLQSQGDASLLCDRSMLRRALSNLISNAIRYGREDSTVMVTVSADTGWIQIDVSNQGDDIPAVHLAHIFDRFYQVSESRTHAADGVHGLGLGLAITRAIMRAHGGMATAESAAGTTIFSLRFPLRQTDINVMHASA